MATVQLHYVQETSLMEASVQYVSYTCAQSGCAHCGGYIILSIAYGSVFLLNLIQKMFDFHAMASL